MFYRFFQRPFDYFFPLILFVLLLMYAFYDVSSSAQAGNLDVSRNSVYIIIIAILSFLFVSILIQGFRYHLKLPILPSVFMILLWIIINNLVNETMGRPAQINIMICLLWVCAYYSFYLIARKAHFDHFFDSFFAVLFLVYCGINIYAQQNIAIAYGRDYGMTSYSYYLLSFLPALLLGKNRKCRSVLVIVCSIMILFSFKRGPILALPVILSVYWLSRAKLGEIRMRFSRIIMLVIVAYGVLLFVNHITNGFLLDRFSSQELSSASGRDQMWTNTLEHIRNRDINVLLIGTGSGTSIQLLGTGVHNEWLEFLYTFGIIGVFLYFIFFISLIRRYSQLLRLRSKYSPQYGSAVAFYFLSGLTDGFFFVYWTFYFFSTIGYIEALKYREFKGQNNANAF